MAAAPVTPAPDQDLPPPAEPAITTAQKMALIKALLGCMTMSDRQLRATIVEELPPGIRFNIRRSERDREDVSAIVTAVLNYPDGLERLLEIVRLPRGRNPAYRKTRRNLYACRHQTKATPR